MVGEELPIDLTETPARKFRRLATLKRCAPDLMSATPARTPSAGRTLSAQVAPRIVAAQRPHTVDASTRYAVRPMCTLRARPLSRRPGETPCGGLPAPFPTSPPPQGDPRVRSGMAPANGGTGRRNNGERALRARSWTPRPFELLSRRDEQAPAVHVCEMSLARSSLGLTPGTSPSVG